MKNRIKEIRWAKGISAASIADACGTTTTQLYRLEKGDRELSLEWAEKIAKALGVKPYELLDNEEWNPNKNMQIGNVSNVHNSAIAQGGNALVAAANEKLSELEEGILEIVKQLDLDSKMSLYAQAREMLKTKEADPPGEKE